MVYSTRKQTERFEDALMELGALGLLEIEGQKLLQESSELNAAEETQPTEKTWNTVKRNLWKQKQKNRFSLGQDQFWLPRQMPERFCTGCFFRNTRDILRSTLLP